MQKQENLSLYDSVTPGLQPGIWQLRTSQTLRSGGKTIDTGEIAARQSFIVEDPVFSVEDELIVQRTPLPDSQGCYTDVIPHIVLKGTAGSGRAGFALLLLKKEELSGRVREITVEEYLKPEDGRRIPRITCTGADVLSRPYLCLSLSRQIFEETAPKETELSLLTHYRQVYIGDKPEMDLDADGIFTVVLSNRMPVYEEGICTAYEAHLVSLAGVYSCLSGPDGGSGDEESAIELLSLAHWEFSVTGKKPDSFRKICERLNREGDSSDMLMKLPLQEGMEPVGKRLAEGYVPMLYHTRIGDEGLCWNRSPFTPVRTELREGSKPFETADGALCYDREEGVFDVSLAAAFEAGRMAALQDGAYLDSLLLLRREAQRLTDELLSKRMSGFEEDGDFSEDLSELFRRTGGDGIPAAPGAEEEKMAAPEEKGEKPAALEAEEKKTAAPEEKGEKPAAPEEEEDKPAAPDGAARIVQTPDFPELTKEDVEEFMENRMQELIPRLDECGMPVARWLAKLLLFYPLPYDSLIPHEALLPKESVRFFFVDENWRQALYDGAVSIGLYSERQSLFNRLIWAYLYDASRRASLEYRAKLYGQTPPAGSGCLSGFLVRAGMAAFWPSVSVEGRDRDGARLAILRMEHLAQDVLLAIFDGIAETVVVNEPEEGLALRLDPEEFPAFRGENGVLCLEPGAENSLLPMIAEKLGSPVGEIASAAFARCFLTTGERTLFGEVRE